MTWIKGKRAVLEALKAGSVDRILIGHETKKKGTHQGVIEEAKRKRIKVQTVPLSELDHLVIDRHQGIIAYAKMDQGGSLKALESDPNKHPQVVILDHIQDPYNFGAILRTCETLGITTVIYPKDRAAQLSPTVTKVSSGAVHHLNLIKVTNIGNTIDRLKQKGYWVYGADSNQGERIEGVTGMAPWILVVGNEEKGISARILKQLDTPLMIPMAGQIESMNVSVATGICLYQLTQEKVT